MTRSNGTITYKGRSKKVKGAYVYIVRKEFPADSMTGKRQSKSVTVHGTHDDAEKALNDLEIEHEKQTKGLCVDPNKITFAEYADLWLKSQQDKYEHNELAERTMVDNRCIVNVLCSTSLGSMKLKDIKADTLEALYSQLRETRGIGGTRLNKYHVKVKQILHRACVNDILTRNVADLITAPRKEKSNRRALTADEASRLLHSIEAAEAAEYEALQARASREHHWCNENGISRDNDKPRTALRGLHTLANLEAVRIMLSSGCRLGEVMALRVSSFDIAKGTLTINHSLTNSGHLKSTKTNRDRTIAIDGNTRMALIRWLNIQRENLARLGIEQTDTTPIICSDTGGYSNINNWERWWREFRTSIGFPDLVAHSLRHTAFSLLVASNQVDLKTIQERGGWASPQILLSTYAHAYEENDKAAAELLGNLLTEQPEQPEQSEPTDQTRFEVIKSA